MKSSAWLLLSLAVLFVQMPASAGWAGKWTNLTEKDDGKVVVVVRDATKDNYLDVRLPQGSSAECWIMAKYNQEVLKIEYIYNPMYSRGEARVVLKAVAAGTSDLELHLQSTSEPDAPPTKTFRLTVRVE